MNTKYMVLHVVMLTSLASLQFVTFYYTIVEDSVDRWYLLWTLYHVGIFVTQLLLVVIMWQVTGKEYG